MFATDVIYKYLFIKCTRVIFCIFKGESILYEYLQLKHFKWLYIVKSIFNVFL